MEVQAQACHHKSWLGGTEICLSPCLAIGSNPGSSDLNFGALATELRPRFEIIIIIIIIIIITLIIIFNFNFIL